MTFTELKNLSKESLDAYLKTLEPSQLLAYLQMGLSDLNRHFNTTQLLCELDRLETQLDSDEDSFEVALTAISTIRHKPSQPGQA